MKNLLDRTMCFQTPRLTSNGGEMVLSKRRNEDMEKGKMTVQEAGRKGGAKGGPRVRELIEEGKEHEEE
jgi:hypothetical protein